FVPQAYVGANPVSPGKQATGPLFSQAQPSLTNVSPVSIKVSTNRASAQLNYGSTSGRIYTLWQAGEVTGPYKVSNGGVATNAAGQFLDTNSLPANRRFYHITTP
ncbi:MAG: hypothetical protein NTW03_15610, partial [Verrucomicrobia bacterium]|nr:hypothetical protein [Verrucomicrobiota bacterium]